MHAYTANLLSEISSNHVRSRFETQNIVQHYTVQCIDSTMSEKIHVKLNLAHRSDNICVVQCPIDDWTSIEKSRTMSIDRGERILCLAIVLKRARIKNKGT